MEALERNLAPHAKPEPEKATVSKPTLVRVVSERRLIAAPVTLAARPGAFRLTQV
jgi:hypothetical protein